MMITVSKVRHLIHRIPEGCKKIDKQMKNLCKAGRRRYRAVVTALRVHGRIVSTCQIEKYSSEEEQSCWMREWSDRCRSWDSD